MQFIIDYIAKFKPALQYLNSIIKRLNLKQSFCSIDISLYFNLTQNLLFSNIFSCFSLMLGKNGHFQSYNKKYTFYDGIQNEGGLRIIGQHVSYKRYTFP